MLEKVKIYIKLFVIEIFLTLGYIVINIFSIHISGIDNWKQSIIEGLSTYFIDSRINLIINMSLILLGIYATITSVFGSSRSAAISKLADSGLTNNLIIYISCALTSALILPMYLIFIQSTNMLLVLFLSIWMIICLIRFLFIIVVIYNYNVKKAKEMDEMDEKNYKNIYNVLEEININIKKK